MQCSNVHLLTEDLRSCQQSAPQQVRFSAHPTSDLLKVFSDILSCTRSRTRRCRLVFPTLTLVRVILLQAVATGLQAVNNSSFFQMQLSISHFHDHPEVLSSLFRNFHWKSARFMSHNAT